MKAPAKAALDLVLQITETHTAPRVCSYTEDFGWLWDFEQGDPNGLRQWLDSDGEHERTLVIVWDGFPPSGETTINIADRVTAFDWVVALFLGFARWRVQPRLRVSVLDLASRHHAGAFAVRIEPMWRPLLPWVRVYDPAVSDAGSRAPLRELLEEERLSAELIPVGVDQLVADLGVGGTALPHPTFADQPCAAGRDVVTVACDLQRFWRAELTRAETRHDVSNLIGPLVLERGVKESTGRGTPLDRIGKNRPLRNALIDLLDVLGLFDPDAEPPLTAEEPQPERRLANDDLLKDDIFGRFQAPVRVLLVDDDADEGYADLIATFLGPKRFTVTAEASPTLLLRWLEQSVPTPTATADVDETEAAQMLWAEPRVLGEEDTDILLLDLRLFMGRADNEIVFLDSLTAFYDERGAHHIRDAHIKRAYEGAVYRLRQLRAKRDEQAPDESETTEARALDHLALLPLLLSHADPSLPIVLFSSTRQRVLLDALSRRPNIITVFSKPIVSGYAERISPSTAVADLHRALRRALELHEARVVWERLPNLDWAGAPSFALRLDNEEPVKYNVPGGPASLPRLRGAALQVRLAELYTDYLIADRSYDFASVPWELLEGTLMPQHVLDNLEEQNPPLLLWLPGQEWPHNRAAQVLKYLRNKKAHGHLPRALLVSQGQDEGRWGGILAFLLLLDFIRVATHKLSKPLRPLRLWTYLCSKYSHLQGSVVGANRLAADQRVGWLDFMLYAAAGPIHKPGTELSNVSPATLTGLKRLAKRQIRKFDDDKARLRTQREREQMERVQRTLYVGLGETRLEDEQLISYFAPRPQEVIVREGAPGLYYAFVTFPTQEDAKLAFANASGWPGWMRVDWYRP